MLLVRVLLREGKQDRAHRATQSTAVPRGDRTQNTEEPHIL